MAATCLPSADTLNQISESWQLLTTTFGDLTHSTKNENVLQNMNVLSSLDNLFNHELDRSFIDWYFDEIGQYLKEEIVEPFRNKSKNILALHHRQMQEAQVLTNANTKQLAFMNFDSFDVEIWANFLHEISNIIEEVYSEIFKIQNNVTKLATLLNALYSKRKNPSFFSNAAAANQTLSELSNRLNTLIDTIFLMDGCHEFEMIFRIMFEYAFIYFSKISKHQNDRLVVEFNKVCSKLHTLRWLKILQSVFINVAYDNIQYELHRKYQSRKGSHFIDYSLFEHPKLQKFQTWVNQNVIAWLQQIIVQNASNENTQQQQHKNSALNLNFADLVQKIDYFVYEKFGEMRTREMFDIILTYPQSTAALHDLKQCLTVTSEWRTLQISMLSSFKKRLLHHGASSKDIITQYIATIGALKQLDPTGITLEIIGEPMRIYLREREDAIRCVVAHLMETDSGLLREFQEKSLKKQAGNACLADNNDDLKDDGNESEDSVDSDMEDDTKQWQPDPLDSMIAKSSIFKRNSDTIGLLVKIFGSKEIFVEEYRKLLGDRLLSRQSDFFKIDKETEYLELMKLRFGDDSMADCQVMVKDIMNSQRDTSNIQPIVAEKLLRQNPLPHRQQNHNTSCEQMSKCLDATILSSQYWPQTTNNNETEKLDKELPYKLPKAMQNLFTCFEETYAEIKKPRQIYWLAQHGCVDLEIELNSHVVKLKTKPLHASLLMVVQEYFDEMKMNHNNDGHSFHDEYKSNLSYISCQQLCDRIGMEEEELMTPLSFWLKRGIIKRVYVESNNEHQLVGYRIADGKQEEMHALNCLKRKLNQKSNANLMDADNDEEDDDIVNMNNTNEERESIAADFERTVLGVLTAFQGSPIERILTRVKQMQLHPLYAKISIHQLQNVLDKLTNEKRVVFQDGEYRRSR